MAREVYIIYANSFLIAPYYALLFNLGIFILLTDIHFKHL
jgi:hypothetical protein